MHALKQTQRLLKSFPTRDDLVAPVRCAPELLFAGYSDRLNAE